MVSTLVYQSLHEDYCATYGSCDFMVTLNSLYLRCYDHFKLKNNFFDTRTPSCCNHCVLKLVYSLWNDRLVMYLYGDLTLAIFKIVFATLKSEYVVFDKRSLCGVTSYIWKFVWRPLHHMWFMWLYGDLKLTIFKMLWSP